MSDENNTVNWQQFWEHTREMLNRGEIPGGEFYKTLTQQAATRAITYEEFYYLLSRYPSIIIRRLDVEETPKNPPQLIKSRSGWDIQDFGDWIATSPGRLLWGPYRESAEDDEEGGESDQGGKLIRGKGTLVQQYIDTAYDVIAMAVDKGWPSAQVVHGFYGMIRAAWVAAEGLSFNIEGFSPTINDQVVLSWVNQLLENRQKEVANRVKGLRKNTDPSV